MRTNRVYVDQRLASGGEIELDQATSHYLNRVLRLRAGAALTVFDGRGGEFAARVEALARAGVRLTIGARTAREAESPLRLTLAQGIARGERMDIILQKATELGVTAIVPLLTARVVVRLDARRTRSRVAHWQKIIVHACQQCGRNRLPEIAPPTELDTWLAGLAAPGEPRLLLHPGGAQTVRSLAPPPDGSAVLLIGPEGGLADRERAAAERSGFTPVAIGPRILRTETAAIATLAILQSHWGDAG